MESDKSANDFSETYKLGELLIAWTGHICQYRRLGGPPLRTLGPDELLTVEFLLNHTVLVEMHCRETYKAQKENSRVSKFSHAVIEVTRHLTTEFGLSHLFEQTRNRLEKSKEKLTLQEAIRFQAIEADSSDRRCSLQVLLPLERSKAYLPPAKKTLFSGSERLPVLSDELYLDVLRITTKTWERCSDEFRAQHSLPNCAPLTVTPLQRRILNALKGRALAKTSLVKELEPGDGSRLFRPGGIKELLQRKLVKNDRKMGGYYRPDAPPPELIQSNIVLSKDTGSGNQ